MVKLLIGTESWWKSIQIVRIRSEGLATALIEQLHVFFQLHEVELNRANLRGPYCTTAVFRRLAPKVIFAKIHNK